MPSGQIQLTIRVLKEDMGEFLWPHVGKELLTMNQTLDAINI